MKYLNNYNESTSHINLYNDCVDCFNDIIDSNDGKIDMFNTKGKEVRLWFKRKENIGVKDVNGYTTHPNDIKEMITHEEEYITLLNDVNTGISRLRDIYTNLIVQINCSSTLTEIFFSI